MFQMAKL